MTTLTVCKSCPAGQAGLAAALRRVLQAEVRETDCMSGCSRASVVAVRAPGKTAYLFGDISLNDVAELAAFALAYQASPDGNFADARGFGALRFKALARIPG